MSIPFAFPAGGIADNVFVYLKFARSANLSAARRGARASNIPKSARNRAKQKGE
jgi:hypothetical protein